MIRRILARRAYNAGKWGKARSIANKLIQIPSEQSFARSVIIRAYYNEGQFGKVVELNNQWGNEFDYLVHRIKNPDIQNTEKLTRIKKIQLEQPEPKFKQEFNETCMVENFHQEGQRVWMRHRQGWVFWDMPKGYLLENTHSNLLILTAEILLYPWVKSTKSQFEETRAKGNEVALSFSAGVDSTAASLLMPEDTILGYHRRSFKTILDHRNANRLIKHLNKLERKIIDIPSNHELIRTFFEKQIGFSSDFAPATSLILLADFLDIGGIGFGTPIDNTYLWKGRKFRDFSQTKYFKYWSERFSEAGIDLIFPLAAVSEGGALEIIKQSQIAKYVNSCLRGDGVNGCGLCWKCFHKNGPLGRNYTLNSSEIQTFLNKEKIPTTTHALWAIQHMKIEECVPMLNDLLNEDFSWWTNYYTPGFSIIQDTYRLYIIEMVKKYLSPMPEPYQLEQVNHYGE